MNIKYTIGAELEFYIRSVRGDCIADLASGKFPQKRFDILPEFQAPLKSLINALVAQGFDITQESGPGQFEVQFKPYSDPALLIEEVNKFIRLSQDSALKHELNIDYSAKPFPDQCGNGLHIHYCSPLFDPYGLVANGGFMRAEREAENDYVLWAIGGMLANINRHSKIFFPKNESYQRLTPYLNAPTKICWGRNNRSCAIRIPDSKPKRIEHRVAGADADISEVLKAVIGDAEYGIRNKIDPGKPVFGNAWDAQYGLELIR